MNKRKRSKRQTMIYKTIHKKLKIWATTGGWTQVIQKTKQFLLHFVVAPVLLHAKHLVISHEVFFTELKINVVWCNDDLIKAASLSLTCSRLLICHDVRDLKISWVTCEWPYHKPNSNNIGLSDVRFNGILTPTYPWSGASPVSSLCLSNLSFPIK